MFDGIMTVRGARLAEYTTLHLGGPADVMAFPRNADEIARLCAEARDAGMNVTVIGHGSNLLVKDGGIRGLTICIGRNMAEVSAEGCLIRAGAGCMLAKTAAAAAENSLAGLEFASGIPGTVGGGVYMNAGAYGGELSQVVREVRAVSPDGRNLRFSGGEMCFGYRQSRAQTEPMIITEVTFGLENGNRDEILAVMADLNSRRAEKQPLNMHSAGSTFKRPEGHYAGALIEQCGLKGYRIGGASVSEKHAGFLVNDGGTAADFLALVRYVSDTVMEKTGVRLEPEIRILGEDRC